MDRVHPDSYQVIIKLRSLSYQYKYLESYQQRIYPHDSYSLLKLQLSISIFQEKSQTVILIVDGFQDGCRFSPVYFVYTVFWTLASQRFTGFCFRRKTMIMGIEIFPKFVSFKFCSVCYRSATKCKSESILHRCTSHRSFRCSEYRIDYSR